MNIFAGLKSLVSKWTVENERSLTDEEKQFVKSAIVVQSTYGLSLEFLTKKGLTHIPIAFKVNTVVGQIPNIDSIKVLTLVNGEDTIYRVEF